MVRIIGLLALAAGLAACSTVKLAYDNLDDIAYWWMDSYVDFSDVQAARVRADLTRLHRWHRRQELPQISALLNAIEQMAPGDISAAQVCGFEQAVRARIDAVTGQGEGAVVSLAMSLAPEQLAYLERKFERVNRDYTNDWLRLEPAAMRDKRFDKMVERFEMVYGSLDEKQKAALRTEIDRSVFEPRRLYVEQRRRQQDLLRTLRQIVGQSLPAAEAGSLLRAYLQRAQESPDAVYRAYQQALVHDICAITSAVHNSTAAPQREVAARRLRAWQRDLKELAAQP